MTTTTANIASHLEAMAALEPKRAAIIAPAGSSGGTTRWQRLSFDALQRSSDAYAHGLTKLGVGPGVKTVLMAPPGLEFFGLVFGLFKCGAIVVLIDPGIERQALLQCLDEVRPQAFVGVLKAQLARRLFPKPFVDTKTVITLGPALLGGHSAEQVRALGGSEPFAMTAPTDGQPAAILYTSGSTGVPKGAVYTHDMFDAQVRTIRRTYGIAPGEVDLATFPLFALFGPALGMTVVLPDMDFRFPAKADPAHLVEAIRTHRCTTMFGSPALVDNLGRHGLEHGVTLPTLRRVLCAGAPVRPDVLERMQRLLVGDAQVHTPFGATESLPVASIGSREVLTETARGAASGQGLCVGRPVQGVTARIIGISDEPIATWSDELQAPQGEIGEICVAGTQVTHSYHARPEATAGAKIRSGDLVIHRMGDVGYFDKQGRLWMCGRKGHRVETAQGTLFTVPIEEVFNTHAQVKRTALVGVGPRGQQRPVLLVEKEAHASTPDDVLLAELRELGQRIPATRPVTDLRIFRGTFPVDRRHNAKIEREKLARQLEAEEAKA